MKGNLYVVGDDGTEKTDADCARSVQIWSTPAAQIPRTAEADAPDPSGNDPGTWPVTPGRYSCAQEADDMQRGTAVVAARLDFGEMPRFTRRGLWLASPVNSGRGGAANALRGPEKYRILDLKRRRAQIRARRELGLI